MKFKSILLALAFLAWSVPAFAGDVRTFIDRSSGSVSAVTAAQIMGVNTQRHFLFIQNIGTQDIWVSFVGTAAASTAGSFKLTAGSSVTLESSTIVKNAVSIISGSGTGKVTAYEG